MKRKISFVFSIFFAVVANGYCEEPVQQVYQFLDTKLKEKYGGESLREALINAGVPLADEIEMFYNQVNCQLKVRGTMELHQYLSAVVSEIRANDAFVPQLPKFLVRNDFQLSDGTAIRFNQDHTITTDHPGMARWSFRRDTGVVEMRGSSGDIVFTAHLQTDGSTFELRSPSLRKGKMKVDS